MLKAGWETRNINLLPTVTETFLHWLWTFTSHGKHTHIHPHKYINGRSMHKAWQQVLQNFKDRREMQGRVRYCFVRPRKRSAFLQATAGSCSFKVWGNTPVQAQIVPKAYFYQCFSPNLAKQKMLGVTWPTFSSLR